MELSVLCGQDISLVIHDRRKSKLIIFRSSEDFTSEKVENLHIALGKNELFENYTNKDYDNLCDTKIKTCQAREWKNYAYKNTIMTEHESYDSQLDSELQESLNFESEKLPQESSHLTRR